MRQKVLLFSAVLFFGLGLLTLTSSSLDATSCDCYPGLFTEQCPEGQTAVSYSYGPSHCSFVYCATEIVQKCSCDCCGEIHTYYRLETVECRICEIDIHFPPLP